MSRVNLLLFGYLLSAIQFISIVGKPYNRDLGINTPPPLLEMRKCILFKKFLFNLN